MNRGYNPEFLDYLSRQVELHVHNGNWRERRAFRTTIRYLYPEFTPKLSVIPSEIEEMREKVTEKGLRDELISEVVKKGISEYLVEEVIKDPKHIKERMVLAKKCSEKKYSLEMYQFCLKYNYDPDDEYSETVGMILDTHEVEEFPAAFVRGKITLQEVYEILQGIDMTQKRERRTEHIHYVLDKLLKDKIMKGVKRVYTVA